MCGAPDPEVPEKAQRRYYAVEYKLRILEEVDERGVDRDSERAQETCSVPWLSRRLFLSQPTSA